MDIDAVRGKTVSEVFDELVSESVPSAIRAGLLPPMRSGEVLIGSPSYFMRLFFNRELGRHDDLLCAHISSAALVLYASKRSYVEAPERQTDALDSLALGAVRQAEFLRGMLAAIPRIRRSSTEAATMARRAQGAAKRERIASLARKHPDKSKRAAAWAIAKETSFDFEQVRRVLMAYFPSDSWPPRDPENDLS